MAYEKKEQLYEGKAKKVFATGDPEVVFKPKTSFKKPIHTLIFNLLQ